MTWVKLEPEKHRCGPLPQMDKLTNGDRFRCDECGRVEEYWYKPGRVDSPMGDGWYNGIHGFRTIKEGAE